MSFSGHPSVFGIDPHNESTTQLHPLGTKGVAPDGRIFRYGQAASTAIAVGKLCIAPVVSANHEDIVFQTAGAIGDKTVAITVATTAIVANEYDEGYLAIVDDTGEGHTHKIVGHDAGTGTINIQLEDGLVAATTTSTTVTLMRNPYRDVVIAVGGTQTDIPVGVTPIAVTADNYAWFATGGYHSVLMSGTNTPTAGEPVTIGEATNGSVSGRDAVAEPLVGIAQSTTNPVSGEHNVVYLTLDR